MSLERNMIGFEVGTFDEFNLHQAGTSLQNNASTARTGNWFLRMAPSAQQTQARIASDGIVLSGSYAGSGHLRFHCRFFMRINSLPLATMQLFILDTICAVFIGNTGVMSANFTGHAATTGPTVSADGLWHQVDVDFDMDGGTPATSTWKFAIDGGSYTTVTQINAGPFGAANYSFGDNNNGTFSVDIDDVVMWSADQSDAASAITMPVATHVLPYEVEGNGSFNQWSGTYVDVQDVPPNLSPDTFQAGTAVGQKVDYIGPNLSFMDNPSNEVDGFKIYGWLRHQGSGTQSVQVTFNGSVVRTITTYPVSPVAYPTAPLYRAYSDWTQGVTVAALDNYKYGFTQNGTCQINAGSVFAEILIKTVVPEVLTITPNSGTWKGGTAFKVTGKYFQPSSVIYFQQTSGLKAATLMQYIDSQNMAGVTPPDVTGAEACAVTAA